jgi:hypothetical protein
LQLAALSMRDREEVSGFVEAFYVLDFLAEEVLARQTETVSSSCSGPPVAARLRARTKVQARNRSPVRCRPFDSGVNVEATIELRSDRQDRDKRQTGSCGSRQ